MKRNYVISFITIFLLSFISVAYAAFNSELTITGEGIVQKDTTAPTCGTWYLRDSSLTIQEAYDQDAFINPGTNETWTNTDKKLFIECTDNMEGEYGCINVTTITDSNNNPKYFKEVKEYTTSIQTDSQTVSVTLQDAYLNSTTCTLPVGGSNPYIDKQGPTVTITQTAANRFTYSATDDMSSNITLNYMVTTSSTQPALDDSNWSSTASAVTIDNTENKTYYVWAKDGINISSQSISTYKLTKTQGTGTTLTTRYRNSSGTSLSSGYVLSGTQIYVAATPKTGYNTIVLKKGTTTLATGTGTDSVNSTQTITADTTFDSSATVNTYTVNFDANGGTGTMPVQILTYNQNTTLSTNTFTRDGYTFAGWNTEADGSGTSYTDGQNKPNVTSVNGGTATLYAQWTANSYTVTANANGGTIASTTGWTGTGNTATKSVTYDSAYGTLPTISRDGYTLEGWNGKNNINIADLQTYSNWSTTLASYGNYPTTTGKPGYLLNLESGKTYTISFTTPSSSEFVPNFFLCKKTSNTTNLVDKLTTDSILHNTYTFTAESGYEYYIRASISNESDFNQKIATISTIQIEEGSTATPYEPYYIEDTTTVTIAGNHEINAIWSINQYTLTINPNGGSYNNTTSNTTVSRNYGTTYDVLNNPTRTGYLFKGWTLTSGDGEIGYEEDSEIVKQYKYTSTTGTLPTIYNNAGGGTVTQQIVSDSNSSTGYSLKLTTNGTASPGAGGIYQTGLTAEASSIYYHVIRAKIPTGYSIMQAANSRGANGADYWLTDRTGTGEYKTYIYTTFTGSNAPFSSFGHIYITGSNNTSVTWNIEEYTIYKASDIEFTFVDSDATLTAQWTANGSNITLDRRDGTFNTSKWSANSRTYSYLTSYASPHSAPWYTSASDYGISRAGYTFGGWYTSHTGGIQIFDVDGRLNASVSGWSDANRVWQKYDASTTLYARWTKEASGLTVTLSQDTYTYDGSAKEPTVTVKDGTTTIPSSAYTVTYSDNTNAGTATVTITMNNTYVSGTKAFYSGSTSTTFTISKAPNPLTVSNTTVYAGKANNSLSAKVSNAEGTVTYAKGTDNTQNSGSSVDPNTGVFNAGVLAANDDSNKTVTVIVTAAGNDNYESGSATMTVSVKKYDARTLTWTDDSTASGTTLTYGVTTYKAVASVSGTGGTAGTVSYESSDTTGATISGTGAITVVNGNNKTITITASLPGTTTVKASTSITRVFTTGKAANPLTVSNTTVYAGKANNSLSAKVSNAEGTVTYAKGTDNTQNSGSSVDPNTGVFNAGVLAANDDSNKTVTVIVTAAGNDNYESGSATMTVSVKKYNARTLAWTDDSTAANSTLTYGVTTYKAVASVSGTGGTAGTVSYSSSNTSGATISSTGAITVVNGNSKSVTITASLPGTTTVKASTSITRVFTTGKANCLMTVSNASMNTGNTLDLTTKTSNAVGTVSYAIKTNGTTTASTLSGTNNKTLTAGAMSAANDNNQTVVVTATEAETDNYSTCSKDITVTVSKKTNPTAIAAVTGLKYGASSSAMVTATSTQGTPYYAVGTSLTSSNYSTSGSTTIPTVSTRTPNTYTVYYYIPSTTTYAVKSGNVSVTIGKADCKLAVSNGTMTTGGNMTLSDRVTDSSTGTKTYAIKTNGTTTASTLSNGVLTAGAMSANNDNSQSVVVTVTDPGDSNYNNCTKDTTITVNKQANTLAANSKTVYVNSVNNYADIIKTNNGGALTATVSSDGTTGGSNDTTNKKYTAGVLSTSNDNNGSVVLAVTSARTTTVAQSTVNVTLTVQKYTNALSWSGSTPANNTNLVYGTSYTATATAETNGGTNGAITYSSGTPATMTINSTSGAITLLKADGSTSVITASMARTSTVKAATTTRTFGTTKATCPAPTNVAISSAGVVTWTAASGASSYEISTAASSGFTAASSGVDYNSSIVASTGTRNVYVRSVCDTNYYTSANSSNASQSTTVFSLTLTTGTGISAVSGGGNYITGATAAIDATVSSGYAWTNWTGTSTIANKSTNITMNANKSYTANATANDYTITYNYNNAVYVVFSNGESAETDYYIDWDKDFTISGKFKYGTASRAYLVIGNLAGDSSDSSALSIEMNTANKMRVVIGNDIDAVSSTTVKASTDIIYTFTWVASTHTYTLTATGSSTNISMTGTATSMTGSSTNSLKYGTRDYESTNRFTTTSYHKELSITKKYTFGDTLTNPESVAKPQYTFNGWYTAASNGDQVTNSTPVPAADTTYYAHWTAYTYTVVFNSNGGTGQMANEVYSYDESKALTQNAFTRQDYTFIGWTTTYTGSSTVYYDGRIVSNLTKTNNGTVNLYAQWRKTKYDVVYDANGGTGTMSNDTLTYGTTEALSANEYTKTGYSFVKYNTKADGTGTQYDYGTLGDSSFVNINANMFVGTSNPTLPTNTTSYALSGRWAKTSTSLTPTLIDVTDAPSDLITKGFNIPQNTTSKSYYMYFNNMPVEEGQTYTISVYAKGSGSLLIKAGNSSPKKEETFTNLTDTWTRYSIKIIAQSGSTAGTDRVRAANLILNEISFGTPAGNGAVQICGFKMEVGETATEYTDSNNQLVLYDQWAPNAYTLTYDKNSDSAVGATMPSEVKNYDQSFDLSKNTYSLKGYGFAGWSTVSSATLTSRSNNSYSKTLTSSSSQITTSTINISSSSAYGYYQVSFEYYGTATLKVSATNQADSNYQLTGSSYSTIEKVYYYGSSAGTGTKTITFTAMGSSGQTAYLRNIQIHRISSADDRVYRDQENVKNLTTGNAITLYAIWNRTTYSLTYQLNNGTVSPANPTSYHVNTSSITLNNPTKDGYTFTGWTEKTTNLHWYEGYVDASGEVGISETYPNSYYSDLITLKAGVTYTITNGPNDIIWRVYNSSGSYQTTTSGTTYTPGSKSYVRLLYYNNPSSSELTNTYITNDAGTTATIPKGSVENKTFTANYTINDPAVPTISGGGGKVWGHPEGRTLTCAEATTYESNTNLYYEFGYATSQANYTAGTITWLGNVTTTKTYVVPTTGWYGSRYYGCRVYASDGTSTTSTIQATSPSSNQVVNSRFYFNVSDNGGINLGPANVYVPYGSTDVYGSRTDQTQSKIRIAAKMGYTFTGWYTAASGGDMIVNPAGVAQANVSGWTDENGYWARTNTSNNDTSNVLYAQFTKDTYSITYELDGGSVSPANPSTYAVDTSTITLTNPTKSGAQFTGWTEKITNIVWQDGSFATTETQITDGSYPNPKNSDYIFLKAGVTYTMVNGPTDIRWRTFDLNGTLTGNGSATSTYTPASDCYVRILFYNDPTQAQLTNAYITSDAGTTATIPVGSTMNRTYVANYTVSNKVVTYNNNKFVGTTKTEDGLTMIWNETDSTITLNGTSTATNTMLAINYDTSETSFTLNTQYKMTIQRISGTFTNTASAPTVQLVADIYTSGNAEVSPRNNVGVAFETSGNTEKTQTMTVSSSGTTGSKFFYWIWMREGKQKYTFNNYKLKVNFTRVYDTKNVSPGSTYGTLLSLSKSGYTFRGWNGKNLFDKDSITRIDGSYITGAGALTSNNEYSVYTIMNIKPSTTYTLKNSGASTSPGYVIYDSTGNRVGGANYNNAATVTFTTPATAYYIKVSVVTLSSSARYDKETFQLEEGSSATAYEPYIISSSTVVTQTDDHTLNAIWAKTSNDVIYDYNLNRNFNSDSYMDTYYAPDWSKAFDFDITFTPGSSSGRYMLFGNYDKTTTNTLNVEITSSNKINIWVGNSTGSLDATFGTVTLGSTNTLHLSWSGSSTHTLTVTLNGGTGSNTYTNNNVTGLTGTSTRNMRLGTVDYRNSSAPFSGIAVNSFIITEHYSTIPSGVTAPDPAGHHLLFEGWTGSNGIVPEYDVVVPANTTGTHTYYANWSTGVSKYRLESSGYSTSNEYIFYKYTIDVQYIDKKRRTAYTAERVLFYRSNNYNTYSTGDITVNYNGTSYNQSISSTQIVNMSGTSLWSRNWNSYSNSYDTVTYDSNGTKSVTIRITSFSHKRFGVPNPQTYTVSLPSIN